METPAGGPVCEESTVRDHKPARTLDRFGFLGAMDLTDD
jgi:hypothetical protein